MPGIGLARTRLRLEGMFPPASAAKQLASNLVAAALCGVVTISYASSFGGLVFGGPLEPFVGRAVIAALVSSLIVLPMLAWRSSFFFSLGGTDSNPAQSWRSPSPQ